MGWRTENICIPVWLVQSIMFVLALTAHLCRPSPCLSLGSSASALGSGRSVRRCPWPPPCPFSPHSVRLLPTRPLPPLAPEGWSKKSTAMTDKILIATSDWLQWRIILYPCAFWGNILTPVIFCWPIQSLTDWGKTVLFKSAFSLSYLKLLLSNFYLVCVVLCCLCLCIFCECFSLLFYYTDCK